MAASVKGVLIGKPEGQGDRAPAKQAIAAAA